MEKNKQITKSISKIIVIRMLLFSIIEYSLFVFLSIKIHLNLSSANVNYQYFQIDSKYDIYGVIFLVTSVLILLVYLIIRVLWEYESKYISGNLLRIISIIRKWFYRIYIVFFSATLVMVYVALLILPLGFLVAVFIALPFSIFFFVSFAKVFRISSQKRFFVLYCIGVLLFSVLNLFLLLIYAPKILDLLDVLYYVIFEQVSLLLLLTAFILLDNLFRKRVYPDKIVNK